MNAGFEFVAYCGVFLISGGGRVVHHVCFALPKLELFVYFTLVFLPATGSSGSLFTPLQISRCGSFRQSPLSPR